MAFLCKLVGMNADVSRLKRERQALAFKTPRPATALSPHRRIKFAVHGLRTQQPLSLDHDESLVYFVARRHGCPGV